MLLNKQQTLPYIAVFKLSTGDEFLTKVLEITDTEYVVSKPLTIVSTEQGWRFVPLVMMADIDADIRLPKNLVIVSKPQAELESQYQAAVSGIVLPKTSSIIA
jgi:hypothetical protein